MNALLNLQPKNLSNEFVSLKPLQPDDFERLYLVASDPLIWEQHPNKNRYQREVFNTYFEGAIESKGAFIILESKTGQAIGSSRFYDYDPIKKTVLIGYTFLARAFWGTTYNRALKTLMLNYAFTFADSVIFHIGGNNIRSQKAIERLGAMKIAEEAIAYHGESTNLNFVYEIRKETWKGVIPA